MVVDMSGVSITWSMIEFTKCKTEFENIGARISMRQKRIDKIFKKYRIFK